MKTKHVSTVSAADDPPPGSVWPTIVAFGGLTVVVLGVMLYVAQDVPEREVATRKPPAAMPTAPEQPAAGERKPAERHPSPLPADDEPSLAPDEPNPFPEEDPSPPAPADALVVSSPPEFSVPSLEPGPFDTEPMDLAAPESPPQAPRSGPESGVNEDPLPVDGASVPEPATPSEPRSTEFVVPDKATVTAKTKELRQVFKTEYATKDSMARTAFARRLAQDAAASMHDPATAWVLAAEARDQAIQAGDWETFVAVGHLLTDRFDVDTHDESIAAFARLPGTPDASSDWYQGLLAELRGRVDAMCDRDDFERAAKYASVAKTIATRASDAQAAQEWAVTIKELGTSKMMFGPYRNAKETIHSNPSDASASAKWGTYLCLIKGNFPEGLSYLAKGDNPALASLAKRDTNTSRDAEETASMADEWWALGERSKAFRTHAWRHAVELYHEAEPGLTGLAAAKVQKRIEEAAAATAPRDQAGNSLDNRLTASPWNVQWENAMPYRGRPTPENEQEWSRDEVITFYEGGRVDSRTFERYEIRGNVIELYVSQNQDEPPGAPGPPGMFRDRRRHGRAILVGDELRLIYGTIDRMDNPRNRGTGTRQEVE